MTIPKTEPPKQWTSWRDLRNETVITVIEVRHWNGRFGLLPLRGHGSIRAEVEEIQGGRIRKHIARIEQDDFEDYFELIYDPHVE